MHKERSLFGSWVWRFRVWLLFCLAFDGRYIIVVDVQVGRSDTGNQRLERGQSSLL